MKSKKALVLLAILLVTALLLAGCGNNNTPAATSAPTAAPATDAPAKPAVSTVTFDLNLDGAAGAPAAQQVENGKTVVQPENPTAEGYLFYEWTTDKDGFNAFDFGKAITADLTLYASWSEAYTITFSRNYEGAASETAVIEVGQTVAEPAAPVREGYEFTGWYTDESAVTAFDFSAAPASDMTLYAGWNNPNASYFTVSFDYAYEGAPAPVEAQVEPGSTVSAPASFVRDESHEVEGWYADADKTVAFDFSKPITEDTTVYAKWYAVLEAEYIDVTGLKGVEYSADFSGKGLIERDYRNLGASGGRYITYLYLHNTRLNFVFNASAADEAAKLVLRVGSDVDMELSGATYAVLLNGSRLDYAGATLSQDMKYIDVDLGTVSLKEGENTIILVTVNVREEPMGLMVDNAPNVDCLKIYTDADITWTPHTENIN